MSPLLRDTSLLPPTPLVQTQGHPSEQNMSIMNNSLIEVMDVLNRSMTSQYSVLQETLRQLQSASKEHYIL